MSRPMSTALGRDCVSAQAQTWLWTPESHSLQERFHGKCGEQRLLLLSADSTTAMRLNKMNCLWIGAKMKLCDALIL